MKTLALSVLRVAGLLACVGLAEAETLDNCLSEVTDECFADAGCVGCLGIFGAGVTHSECRARYPATTFCEAISGSICCMIDGDDTCDVSTSLYYWTCILEDIGCFLEDMPCYRAGSTGGDACMYADLGVLIQGDAI